MTLLQILLTVGASLFSVGLTVVITCIVLVRLPADYFTREHRPLPLAGRPRWLRILTRIGLNLAGGLLVLLGIVLSLPGVPGQGLLTILLGIMLLDIPGKRRAEGALLRRRFVHEGINRLRAKYRRPALEVPPRRPLLQSPP